MGLERGHRQLGRGMGHRDGSRAVGMNIPEYVALPHSLAGAGIGGHEIGEQHLGLHAEEHPMDGFELQRAVVEVHQLHQSVPGGQRGPLLRRRQGLLPFIAGLGRGQGVVVCFSHLLKVQLLFHFLIPQYSQSPFHEHWQGYNLSLIHIYTMFCSNHSI